VFYHAVLDIVNFQLKQRFAAMLAVNEKLSVLNPAVLSQLDEFNIMQKATKLQENTRMTFRLHLQSTGLFQSVNEN